MDTRSFPTLIQVMSTVKDCLQEESILFWKIAWLELIKGWRTNRPCWLTQSHWALNVIWIVLSTILSMRPVNWWITKWHNITFVEQSGLGIINIVTLCNVINVSFLAFLIQLCFFRSCVLCVRVLVCVYVGNALISNYRCSKKRILKMFECLYISNVCVYVHVWECVCLWWWCFNWIIFW